MRMTAKMVRSGLAIAWRLAGWPTRRSPSSLKATMDGVVRMPSAFSMTFDVLPSITATHEFVVPRSIPMTFPMVLISFFLRQVGWALTAHLTEPPTINCSRYCDGEPHIGGGAGPARTERNLEPLKPAPVKDSVLIRQGRAAARKALRQASTKEPIPSCPQGRSFGV